MSGQQMVKCLYFGAIKKKEDNLTLFGAAIHQTAKRKLCKKVKLLNV